MEKKENKKKQKKNAGRPAEGIRPGGCLLREKKQDRKMKKI